MSVHVRVCVFISPEPFVGKRGTSPPPRHTECVSRVRHYFPRLQNKYQNQKIGHQDHPLIQATAYVPILLAVQMVSIAPTLLQAQNPLSYFLAPQDTPGSPRAFLPSPAIGHFSKQHLSILLDHGTRSHPLGTRWLPAYRCFLAPKPAEQRDTFANTHPGICTSMRVSVCNHLCLHYAKHEFMLMSPAPTHHHMDRSRLLSRLI